MNEVIKLKIVLNILGVLFSLCMLYVLAVFFVFNNLSMQRGVSVPREYLFPEVVLGSALIFFFIFCVRNLVKAIRLAKFKGSF